MPPASPCPPPRILERFALGQLSPLEVEQWSGHVEQCGRCHAALRAFDGEDAVVKALQRPGSAEAQRQHQLVRSLVEKLVRIQPVEPAPPPRAAPASSPPPAPPRPVDSVAGLVDALAHSRLLGATQRGELAALQGQFREPRGLARELLRRNWLTPFQVNQLFAGRGPELVLGDYVLLERLGEGGFGQVFKARHQLMNRVVAVKVIRKDRLGNAEAVRRFQREIRAAAQLSHPNIITAYDAALVGDTYLLVMEFVAGVDLKRLVELRGPLPVPEACGYVRQAALGLQHAQENGLVHRDIKPANLLLAARGGVVKILDMGLARLRDLRDNDQTPPELTQDGAVMGTPDYMAPEQSLGSHDVDIRADLYSLGCTLFYLLTGRPPFPGGTLGQKIARHQMEVPPAVTEQRPDIPSALGAVVRKLLAKRPEERYRTPAETAAALKPFCGAALARAVPVAVPLPAGSGSGVGQVFPRAIPLGAGPPPAGSADETLAVAGAESVANSPPPLPAGRPARWWAQVRRHRRVAIGGGLLVLVLLLWLALKPGPRPSSTPQERYPWQPSDLVEVVGHHRLWHAQGVNAVAVSANGRLVASAGSDGLVLIGDADTLVVRHYLRGHTAPVRCVAFSPTDPILASGGDDNVVRLWDVAAGKELGHLDGHTNHLTGVAFSPDGRRLLSGSADKTVWLWDVPGRVELKKFTEQSTQVHCVACSPDGVHGICGCGEFKDNKWQNGGAWLLDLQTGKPVRHFEIPGVVAAVAFSPDGRRVLTGGGTGELTVRLWDTATGKAILPPFSGHGGGSRCVAFFPDGRRATSCGGDNLVRVWELQTPGEVRPFEPFPQGTTSLAVYPDGRRVLVASGNQVRLLDVATARELAPLKAPIRSFLALSPDGRRLLTTAEDGWTVDLREVQAGGGLRRFKGHTAEVTRAAWSADGRRFLTGSRDMTLRLWDADRDVTPQPFKLPHDAGQFNLTGVALSPDGMSAVYCGNIGPGHVIGVIEVATGKVVKSLTGQGGLEKVFPPEGTQVFARLGGALARWERSTDKPDWTFSPPGDSTADIVFSPDGRRAYLGGHQGSGWRVDLTKPVPEAKELRKFYTTAVRPQAVSPDGETLAVIVTPTTVALLDGRTGRIVREWKDAFPGGPQLAAFADGGKRLAVANGNGTVYLVDVARLLSRKDS